MKLDNSLLYSTLLVTAFAAPSPAQVSFSVNIKGSESISVNEICLKVCFNEQPKCAMGWVRKPYSISLTCRSMLILRIV
jgi:hypothetical protein